MKTEIIKGPRNSGRTTRLLQLWRQDPNGILLVPTQSYRVSAPYRLGVTAAELTRVYTPAQLKLRIPIKLRGCSKTVGLYVDDAELIGDLTELTKNWWISAIVWEEKALRGGLLGRVFKFIDKKKAPVKIRGKESDHVFY